MNNGKNIGSNLIALFYKMKIAFLIIRKSKSLARLNL